MTTCGAVETEQLVTWWLGTPLFLCCVVCVRVHKFCKALETIACSMGRRSAGSDQVLIEDDQTNFQKLLSTKAQPEMKYQRRYHVAATCVLTRADLVLGL